MQTLKLGTYKPTEHLTSTQTCQRKPKPLKDRPYIKPGVHMLVLSINQNVSTVQFFGAKTLDLIPNEDIA